MAGRALDPGAVGQLLTSAAALVAALAGLVGAWAGLRSKRKKDAGADDDADEARDELLAQLLRDEIARRRQPDADA